MDEDQDRMGEFAGWKEGNESEEREPKEVFKQLSHIAISMSFDLIDKLRFFEKETLKLSDEEIETRIPHMAAFLEELKTAYLDFAEVDF